MKTTNLKAKAGETTILSNKDGFLTLYFTKNHVIRVIETNILYESAENLNAEYLSSRIWNKELSKLEFIENLIKITFSDGELKVFYSDNKSITFENPLSNKDDFDIIPENALSFTINKETVNRLKLMTPYTCKLNPFVSPNKYYILGLIKIDSENFIASNGNQLIFCKNEFNLPEFSVNVDVISQFKKGVNVTLWKDSDKTFIKMQDSEKAYIYNYTDITENFVNYKRAIPDYTGYRKDTSTRLEAFSDSKKFKNIKKVYFENDKIYLDNDIAIDSCDCKQLTVFSPEYLCNAKAVLKDNFSIYYPDSEKPAAHVFKNEEFTILIMPMNE